jgi:LysR family glycine cleavage system transcriptional activator
VSKTLPPLESLRVLATCVRLGNFSRAATELGVTPTAVSQRMRALEAQIGVTLFRRHGPKLTTTDRARALGQRIGEALSLVHGAVDDCRRIKHPLRITCAPTFAARWLVPRLVSYQTLSGASAIALDATQSLSPQGSFDVAIRSGRGPWPGYESVRLLSDDGTPMLSPKWAPPGSRMTVKKLLRVPLIPDSRWAEWFKLAGVPNAKPKFVAARFPNSKPRPRFRGSAPRCCHPIFLRSLSRRAHWWPPSRLGWKVLAATGCCGPSSALRRISSVG